MKSKEQVLSAPKVAEVSPCSMSDATQVQETIPVPQTITQLSSQVRKKTSLLNNSISIADIKKPEVNLQQIKVDVKPLTQENLEQYWLEASKQLGIEELMSNGRVHLGEKNGLFEVDAQTIYFADEFKPYKMDVMQIIRQKTGMGILDCKVNPLYVGKEQVIYSPDAKYNAMLESNPMMQKLRTLFPTIDL